MIRWLIALVCVLLTATDAWAVNDEQASKIKPVIAG